VNGRRGSTRSRSGSRAAIRGGVRFDAWRMAARCADPSGQYGDGVSDAEEYGSLPGDDLIAHPMVEWTRGITVGTPAERVWPWLAQISPVGLLIQAWPNNAAFAILTGEPAQTVLPNLLLSGLLTVIIAVALEIWWVLSYSAAELTSRCCRLLRRLLRRSRLRRRSYRHRIRYQPRPRMRRPVSRPR
jgi:hypothetical protein